MDRNRKLSKRTKFAFATGTLEEAMVFAASATTMIFYNQVMGLSAALCGTVFLIASIIDAISDPMVGALSDSVNTRWGRRHPFMFMSAVPLGLFFYLLYQPPQAMTEGQLFAWFTTMLVGLRLSKSFYAVPHSALGAELTDDYDERTSVFGWSWVVGSVGSAFLSLIILAVLFPSTEGFDNGLLNGDRYFYLALLGSLFCFAMVMICTLATADQIPHLHQNKPFVVNAKNYYREMLGAVIANIWMLIKNPSYIAVSVTWLILSISGGVIAVVSTYTLLYAFEFSTEQIAIRSLLVLPGAFVGLYVSSTLIKLFDKKASVIGTLLFSATLIAVPYILRLMGALPDNDSEWLIVAVYGTWLIGYFFLPSIPIIIDSQLVDITDEHELNTGQRSEGIIFSVRTFAIKMTSGLGGLIGGFALEYIHFPQNASVETITPEVITSLLWIMGPIYLAIVVLGLGFSFLYRIDRARHGDIITQLQLRRQVASS